MLVYILSQGPLATTTALSVLRFVILTCNHAQFYGLVLQIATDHYSYSCNDDKYMNR